MAALSGGQAARAVLAAILLARFDVFLLDEPTNDLDFAGLDRLEAVPRPISPAAPSIVSHDRAFLDRTITACSSSTSTTTRASSSRAGGRRTSTERERSRAGTREEEYETYVDAALGARGRAQRAAAVVGAGRRAR